MPTSYTPSLGLALPVTGELSGTWGDTVNDYITKYVDASVAGTQTISGSQTAVTLATTTGGTLSQAGSGSTGSAQYMVINCTGNPASLLTITAPASSKIYLILNSTSTSQSVKVVGVGPTTGVTIASGNAGLVAWNGSDFRLVATDDITKLTGTLAVANGGTGATTLTGVIKGNGTSAFTAGNVSLTSEVTGTLPVANGGTGGTSFTANNVLLGNGASAFQVVSPGSNGNILQSNGTTWVSASAPPSGASISNDTSTASNLYPLFSNATTGAPTTIYTSNAKYLYKPSTGELQASELVASNGLVVNNTTVSSSYTIASGTNAFSVGPITVASGQSVTVTSGQRWLVV